MNSESEDDRVEKLATPIAVANELADQFHRQLDEGKSTYAFQISGFGFRDSNLGKGESWLAEIFKELKKGRSFEPKNVYITAIGCDFESLLLEMSHPMLCSTLVFESCTFSKLKIKGGKSLVKEITFREGEISNLGASGVADSADIGVKVTFESVDFKDKFVIRDLKFAKPVTFKKCNFLSSLTELNFSDSEYRTTLSFRDSVFYRAPQFFNSKLHPNTDFDGCKFFDTRTEEAWRSWRVLKQFMIQYESDHEAMEFHALELEARYNTVLPSTCEIFTAKGMETIFSFLLKAITNYGRNLWAPALWIVAIFTFSSSYYNFSNAVHCSAVNTVLDAAPLWVGNLCKQEGKQLSLSLIYSATNIFGPIGLVFSNNAISVETVGNKVISFLEFIVASVIWFLWILQIRARFKL